MLLKEMFSRVLNESVQDLFKTGIKPHFDKFPNNFSQFKNNIELTAQKYLGKDWKAFIEKMSNGELPPGTIDKALRKLWDLNWSEYEAIAEVGFWYDCAQNDEMYYNKSILNPHQQLNSLEGDYDEKDFRTKRPMSPEDFGIQSDQESGK